MPLGLLHLTDVQRLAQVELPHSDLISCDHVHMVSPNLRAALNTQDATLATSLARSRATFQHTTLKGDGSEFAIREALNSHLPRNFSVGTGEVVDLSDTRSQQVDVIIANESQPFRAGIHENGLFLIEGVRAAGEVKTILTTKELKKTLEAATVFKSLRAQRPLFQVFNSPGSQPRFECPPYFLFAFDNRVAERTLLKRLKEAPLVNAADGSGQALPPVDAVFILGKGAVVNYGDGQGCLSAQYDTGPNAGKPITGWEWWHPGNSGIGMFTYFLFWLSAVMPRILDPTPIAWKYLAKAIDLSSP
jgi:hypothetical protein